MNPIIDIFSSYTKTKYFQRFKSKEQLLKWQEKQVSQHLAFLKKASSYYQLLMKEMDEPFTLESLKQFPIMNKKNMMEHFDDLNTKGIQKEEAFKVALQSEETRDFSPMIGDVTIGLSSGTSGNRGLFIVSKEERNKWAGTILAKLLPDGILTKEKIAFFLRANSNLYESVSTKRIRFHFFDLLDSIDYQVEELHKFQPSILVAPPSMLRLLADKKKEGLLDIAPKRVISVAEVLEPLDKEYLEQTFQQMIHQVYQCTEGLLAATCKQGTLHLNEDIVYIEKQYLDDENRRFSPIITDFRRTTQPIIRYYLNDILTIKESGCSCGSVMTPIEQIEGRCDDIFYFNTTKDKVIPIFPDFVRRWIIATSNEIEEYKVIQHHQMSLEVQLKTKAETEKIQQEVIKTIKNFLEIKEVKMPNISFTEYRGNEKGTKLKRIERKG